jgi:hypothetical protein
LCFVRKFRPNLIHQIERRKELKQKKEEGGEKDLPGDEPEAGLPGDEGATEMMIEGAAEVAEDNEAAGLRSQLDDGYISPENPTWKSSNCVQVPILPKVTNIGLPTHVCNYKYL